MCLNLTWMTWSRTSLSTIDDCRSDFLCRTSRTLSIHSLHSELSNADKRFSKCLQASILSWKPYILKARWISIFSFEWSTSEASNPGMITINFGNIHKISYNSHHVGFVFNPSQISFSSVSSEWPHKKFQINPLITSCLLDFVYFLFYIRSKTSLNYEIFCTFFKQDVSDLRYDLRFPKYAHWYASNIWMMQKSKKSANNCNNDISKCRVMPCNLWP